MVFLYSDQPPDGKTDSNAGHSKGIVLGDSSGGIWLVHSVPRFPRMDERQFYPDTGLKFGQQFLCISLDAENLNKVSVY